MKIERRLDAGLSGDVYLARTPAQERVALKVLRTPSSPGAFWEKEVLLLSKLRHPHIVSLLGCAASSRPFFGEERGPCYWMEFVDGADLLTAAKAASPETMAGWLCEGLEALTYLHAQNVLHGDLSPRNVLIDGTGRLKLLDFGLASFAGESSAIEAATVPYLAPERLSGIHGPVGDLFALGTLFYEALSGLHPHAGSRGLHEMMSAAPIPLLDAAPRLRKDHAVLARVIDGLIETDLSRRFSRAEDVLEALQGRSVTGKPREATDYHSLPFWGAEGTLLRMTEWVENLKEKTVLVALHGGAGVGKKRFLRETGFQCALEGVSVQERFDGRFQDFLPNGATFFRSLETLTPDELSKVLSLLRSGLPPRGALILLEWNDDFIADEARAFFAHLVRRPEVNEIHLRNLGLEDTFGLLKGGLGEETAAAFSERLFTQTGGNPQRLVQAVARLRAGGKDVDLETVGTWRDHFLWKILSLSDAEKEALARVAAAYGMVGAAPLLQGLADKQLLVQDRPGSYRLALPLLKDTLDEVLSPEERTSVHRRWLQSLEGAPHPNPERLHHAIALKDKAEVAAGARVVADRLWNEGRKKEALAFIDRSLAVIENVPAARVEVSRLWKEKMNILGDLGRYEDALTAAEIWFALGPDNDEMPLKTVKYWFVTGLNHQSLGNEGEAIDRLERCLGGGDESLESHRPFLLRAHSLLGILNLHRNDQAAAKMHLERALALAGPGGRRRAEIYRNLAEVLAAGGDDEGAFRALEEARALYEKDDFEPGVFSTLIQEGNLRLAKDRPEEAASSYAQAEAIAAKHADEKLLAMAWHNQGVVARRQGRLGEALKLLRKAKESFEMLNLAKDLAECQKNLLLAEASLKEVQDLPAAFKENIVSPSKISPNGTLRGRLHPALPVEGATRAPIKERTLMSTTTPPTFDWDPIIERLADLDRELLRENDMDIVLRRLMDSAMEIARAQRGLLVLQTDEADPDSPIPGFTVAVARNINRESLKSYEHVLSLSVVRQAMELGEPVATDNALQDPRFRDAKSVHLGNLRSILALPVAGSEGVLGVFYLDHPMKDGLFQGDMLRALKLFAGLASIALQKGRMIQDLRRKNENLESRVGEQSVQMERLQQEVKTSRLKLKNEYGDIIGRSPRMLEVLSLVDKVTDTKIPVWIYGETGTGKESVARALHFNSSRKNQPFVTENCSALPESLLESELFGHKKGAFTHATSDKKGLLHYADKGTVFLDEIADMSLNLQAKLLRFLQEGEIRPLGSHQAVKVDVRVVSASNKDLRRLVAEEKFREDLFFRLNGITVKLPPLRERLEDLSPLADHFLKGKATLKPETLKLLMSYSWPGNVRELQQTLETALIFAEGGAITRKSLEFKDALFSGAPAASKLPPIAAPSSGPAHAKTEMTPDLERILRAIRDQCYHKGKAAEALGMSRRHLYTKLEQYGVSPESASLKAYIEKNLGS